MGDACSFDMPRVERPEIDRSAQQGSWEEQGFRVPVDGDFDHYIIIYVQISGDPVCLDRDLVIGGLLVGGVPRLEISTRSF